MADPADTSQARFARRWGHLNNPHVRALAWLLDAPDLLDANHPHWQGKVATLGALPGAVDDWLGALERDPAPLERALGTRLYTRLGLYAEQLMAFYFREQGRLVAHALQVRANPNDTVGEFDFLLEHGPDGLEHIEFATKFYLLEGQAPRDFDTFVGPNLADSLGKKMRKIFERQLVLGSHPAAQAVLARPVTLARALVKGWLFYRLEDAPATAGISSMHCRGLWCALGEIERLAAQRFVILPRLQWLAPYRSMGADPVLGGAELAAALAARFETAPMPVLVAMVQETGGAVVETARAFIVPDTWRARAATLRHSA